MDVVHLMQEHTPADGITGTPNEPVLLVLWANGLPVAQRYARRDAAGRITAEVLPVSGAPAPPVRSTTPSDAPEAVSVVICTRDRAEMLEQCLVSLRSQSMTPNQIVVVDNASRGVATRLVCERQGVTYVREDRPGLDYARNAGIRAVTSPLVAFTDDDVVLHERWLEGLVRAFDRDDIMAVTGLVLPAELETRAQIVFERHWSFGRGYKRIDFTREFFEGYRPLACPAWEIGAGASMAFRRTVFEKIGNFDERLDVGAAGCSGDSEYWYRILAAGWTCRYEPDAVAFHFHRRADEDLARQLKAYMRGHVAALMVQFERHRDTGCLRRVFLSLPRWYLSRLWSHLRYGADDANAFLFHEISGAVSGLLFYFRTPRPSRETSP